MSGSRHYHIRENTDANATVQTKFFVYIYLRIRTEQYNAKQMSLAYAFEDFFASSISGVFPPSVSARGLIGSHHEFTPRRFFISACCTISSTGVSKTFEDWIVITAADSRGAARLRSGFCRSTSWYRSRKLIHLSERRTARTRSMGDGIPPCRVCPREAMRESKSCPPSSCSIF